MTRIPSRISIIVPVYNVENYLAKCLDSLVNQTHQNIEILAVNDGSKDRSWEIIKKYAEKYPDKIKALTKENGGLSDARNFGLDRATGDYIGFVDSDDYVTDTMFEEMLQLAEKHQSGIVICNIQKVNENGAVTQKLTQVPHMPEKITLEDHFSVFSDISYFACNKLFRKELFNQKRFKKGAHFEDIQLIPQLLLECETVAQTQAFHYQYLERTDSITKTHTEKGLDILKAVQDVENVFEQSQYAHKRKELKNFQIFEGVYSFLAYLAFVKDEKTFYSMADKLSVFIRERQIKIQDILNYSRFGTNYLFIFASEKKDFLSVIFCRTEKVDKKIDINTNVSTIVSDNGTR